MKTLHHLPLSPDVDGKKRCTVLKHGKFVWKLFVGKYFFFFFGNDLNNFFIYIKSMNVGAYLYYVFQFSSST